RQVGRQPVEPVQERKGVLLAALHALAGSEQARGRRCGAAEQPRPLLRGRRRNRRLEQLPDDPERERGFQLARARVEDRQAGAARTCPRLGEERRLPDSRGPLDHDQPPDPAPGTGDRPVDRGQLFRTFEQRRPLVPPWTRRPRLGEHLGQPVRDELEQRLRLLETGQPHLADRSKPDPVRRVGGDDRLRRARDEDLPAVRRLADAPTAVDGDPDVAVAADRRLAGVQPHPHAHLRLPGPPLGRERTLRGRRRRRRSRRAHEDAEERVSGRVDLGAAARLDRLSQQLALPRQQRAVAVAAEPLEQPRRPLDVCEQERHRPLRQRRLRHHLLDDSPQVCGFSYGASTTRPHPPRSDLLAMQSTREKETAMHHHRHTPQEPASDRHGTPKWLLPLLLVAQLMVILDITAVNIAMPSLAHDLKISGASISWTITAYSLVFGSLLLLGGRAADLLGRRRMFFTGLGIFTTTSLASAMAGSAAALFAARAGQGLGAAMLSPAALSIITSNFHGPARSKALAAWGAVGGAGAALGVLVGGVLTEVADWRMIFFVNLPVAIALAIGARKVIPADTEMPRWRGLDLRGAILATGSLGAIVYTITQAENVGWTSPQTLVTGATGLIGLAAFGFAESRTAQPLLRIGQLRDRALGGGLLLALVNAGLMF